MKRKTIVRPGKAVNASTNSGVNAAKAKRLLDTLKDAYNQLDAMDYDTYEAVDGEAMQEDLDIYLRELDAIVKGR